MINERIKQLIEQATTEEHDGFRYFDKANFALLILANADELNRMLNTDPINKPFDLNPKFVAKCDEIGRSRRQFQ